MPQGRLFVVAGPSGAGKGTLVKELLSRYTQAWLSVSATTRKPRSGEEQGVQYHFLKDQEFKDLARRGDFLEWAEVHGNLYGTPLDKVAEKRSQGQDVILEIDVKGARQVRSRDPDAVAIFVLPPSIEILEERLRGRATEGEAELQERLRNAQEESREKDDFDYVVLNDDLNRAAQELCAIYEMESPVVQAAKKENRR
jgi:guanylate kinase